MGDRGPAERGIATEAMQAAIDDLWGRTEVESITAYIEEGANDHRAALPPSSDSPCAARALGARASR